MKYRLTLLSLLMALSLSAQKSTEDSNPGFAIIKGHIKNNTDPSWDYTVANYLDYNTVSVPIDKNGNFTGKIKIEGYATDFLLRIDRDGKFAFVERNDTLEMNWDTKDPANTFVIKASKPYRNQELNLADTLMKLYKSKFFDLAHSLQSDQITDSEFARVNDLYNKEIETVLTDDVHINTFKMTTDIYFKYAKLLLYLGVLDKYDLFIQHPSQKSNMFPIISRPKAYQLESDEAYKTSGNYRDFVFNYIRLHKPFTAWSRVVTEADDKNKTVAFEPCRADYYAGLSSFHLLEFRDWFITKSIMSDFEWSPFDEASAVYNDFLTKVKTPFYADTLRKFYADIQRLKPGSPAPIFTLKNEKGESVSLSDFKGKVIYIDFWGVGCAPCIGDIKNYAPKLHEKYKDKNIVFLNICVDSDTKTWVENIEKLNLNGINLIAAGWNKNPVCRLYNVNAIPHYYLIDAEGKIYNNNSPTPSESSNLYAEIDKLLNK